MTATPGPSASRRGGAPGVRGASPGAWGRGFARPRGASRGPMPIQGRRARAPMNFRRPIGIRPIRPAVALFLAALAPASSSPASGPSTAPAPDAGRLAVVERVLTQDQGDWQVDYAFRLDAPAPVTLTPS